MLAALTKRSTAVKEAREHTSEGFAFTRRVLAFTAFFSIVALPLVAAAWFPGLPITYGFPESDGLWFFTNENLHFTQTYGLTLLPFHVDIVMAIIGMYFGHSTVK